MPISLLHIHLSRLTQISGKKLSATSDFIFKRFLFNLIFATVYVCRFSAAVAEMLVQSTVKDVYLLPALPRDKWANGCVKGLKVRGSVTVSICWGEGDLDEVGIWSSNGGNGFKSLHYRGTTVSANISSGTVYTFDKHLKCVGTHSLL